MRRGSMSNLLVTPEMSLCPEIGLYRVILALGKIVLTPTNQRG